MIENMMEGIKRSMHLSDEDIDIEMEIMNDILSAFEDMERVGVAHSAITTQRPLVIRCVEMYVKWQHGYLGEPERFQKNYEKLRDALSMGSDYNAET